MKQLIENWRDYEKEVLKEEQEEDMAIFNTMEANKEKISKMFPSINSNILEYK